MKISPFFLKNQSIKTPKIRKISPKNCHKTGKSGFRTPNSSVPVVRNQGSQLFFRSPLRKCGHFLKNFKKIFRFFRKNCSENFKVSPFTRSQNIDFRPLISYSRPIFKCQIPYNLEIKLHAKKSIRDFRAFPPNEFQLLYLRTSSPWLKKILNFDLKCSRMKDFSFFFLKNIFTMVEENFEFRYSESSKMS